MSVHHRDEKVGVLVVDDHPALRAGLRDLFATEPGMRCAGAHADTRDLPALVERSGAAVVVLDYVLENSDGLTACFSVKQRPDPPAVVLYSGYVDAPFTVPATIAGADAVVSKSAPIDDLLNAVRDVAAGNEVRARLSAEVFQAASARLDAADLPLAGMLAGAVPVDRIAQLLDLPLEEVRAGALRIIGRLQAAHRRSQIPEATTAGVRS